MKNRNQILEDCPEGAEDFVEDLLDGIETQVHEIKNTLDIKELSDLVKVEEAFDMVEQLCEALY